MNGGNANQLTCDQLKALIAALKAENTALDAQIQADMADAQAAMQKMMSDQARRSGNTMRIEQYSMQMAAQMC